MLEGTYGSKSGWNRKRSTAFDADRVSIEKQQISDSRHIIGRHDIDDWDSTILLPVVKFEDHVDEHVVCFDRPV